MGEIELVIKIPKEQYSLIMQSHRSGVARYVDKEGMMYAIKNGIPLPEEHIRTGICTQKNGSSGIKDISELGGGTRVKDISELGE